MAIVDEATWLVIRGEYEAGLLSEQQIAEKFDCDRSAITKRARREKWHKPPVAPKVIPIELARRIREGILGNGTSPPTPETIIENKSIRSHDHLMVPERKLSDEARAELIKTGQAEAFDRAVRTVQESSMRHLRMTSQLHDTFQLYHGLVMALLGGSEEEASHAANRILSGKNESVASAIATLCRTAEAIQMIERKALGLEGAKRGGLVGETVDTGVLTNEDGMPTIDVSKLTDAELEVLRRAHNLMTERTRSALPLPPKGPEG